MESCGMNFIKYLLFIFNLVFALSGVGIIVAGALVLADVSQHSHFMDSGILAPSIVLIVAGSIVFIIAFLGCFGAYRESRSMLMAFAGLLLVIFIVELAVGIAAACFKSDFQDGMKKSMSESLKNYNKEGTGDKEAWDNMQKMMMCCGTEGPFDWITDGPSRQLPHSCCHALKDGDEPPTEAQCRQAVASDAYVYQVGCFDKLQMKVKSAANVLIGVGIGIAFIEVIGIVLACWLASAIKKEEEK